MKAMDSSRAAFLISARKTFSMMRGLRNAPSCKGRQIVDFYKLGEAVGHRQRSSQGHPGGCTTKTPN
jgi:hypothetical protein